MINAKKANALLWIGNVVLIVGIVAFAFQFLVFPEIPPQVSERPISIPRLTQPQDPTDPTALAKLPNPLAPMITERSDGPTTTTTKLIGTDSIVNDPASAVAYLEIPARKLNVNAYVDEPIREDSAGQEIAELSGWRLKSVTPKTALFSTPSGPVTLKLEEIVASAPSTMGALPGNLHLAGQPWDPNKFATKKNTQRSNEAAEVWDIDRKEVEWASANADSLMAGVSVEPYVGGGLKINALPEGGFAAERGLRAGDVIKAVNNQQIGSFQQLGDVIRGMSRNATTLTVQVDRSGRIYTLTYTVPRAMRK